MTRPRAVGSGMGLRSLGTAPSTGCQLRSAPPPAHASPPTRWPCGVLARWGHWCLGRVGFWASGCSVPVFCVPKLGPLAVEPLHLRPARSRVIAWDRGVGPERSRSQMEAPVVVFCGAGLLRPCLRGVRLWWTPGGSTWASLSLRGPHPPFGMGVHFRFLAPAAPPLPLCARPPGHICAEDRSRDWGGAHHRRTFA